MLIILFLFVCIQTAKNEECVKNEVVNDINVCDKNIIPIKCCSFIKTLNIVYRNLNKSACSGKESTNCSLDNAIKISRNACYNRTSCYITVSNEFFGNNTCKEIDIHCNISCTCLSITQQTDEKSTTKALSYSSIGKTKIITEVISSSHNDAKSYTSTTLISTSQVITSIYSKATVQKMNESRSSNKTTNSSQINGSLGVWSEWSSWQVCVLEKKRKIFENPIRIEVVRLNISCSLICKNLFIF
jgi:hypothetical protein